MWSRTKLLIDAKMQFKVVVQMAFITLLAAIAILLTVYFHEQRVVGFLETSGAAGPVVAAQVTELNHGLIERLLIIVVLMIITFVVMGLALTHRIAGPIWRIRTELKKVLDGETIRPLQFRSDDEFQDLPQMINQLIEKSKK